MKKKFIFTQLSGPIIGCFVGYGVIRLLFYFFSDWYMADKISHVLVFGTVIILSCVLGILLWGKVLIMLGILSKEEAKGYPFSKPWESIENE
ncbi:MAG: hypothetical protein GY737_20340 [Desulfobacteraceae bacterium]|nr:hypothetical protein [Desulfobacteraceae bacterium]